MCNREKIDELRKKLAEINLLIRLPQEDAWRLCEEVAEKLRSEGFMVYRRAEGYAFFNDPRVGRLALPHLRIAVYSESVTAWIRDPYSLDDEKARIIGLSAKRIYESIMNATKAALEVFERFKNKSTFTHTSVPKS